VRQEIEHLAEFGIPTLETERLRLRAPGMADLDAYAEYCASDRAKSVGGPFSRESAFSRLCEIAGQWVLRGYGRWIVADKGSNDALGVVGLFYPEDWPEPEIAWTVFCKAEGKGIAYEAAMAARDYAYDLGWSAPISCISATNPRSEALARRMNATLEAVFEHPEYGALNIWRHPEPEGQQ